MAAVRRLSLLWDGSLHDMELSGELHGPCIVQGNAHEELGNIQCHMAVIVSTVSLVII